MFLFYMILLLLYHILFYSYTEMFYKIKSHINLYIKVPKEKNSVSEFQ